MVAAPLGAPAAARAEFSAGPSVRDLPLRPGESAVDTFRVRVKGERAHRFVVALEDVSQQPDGGLSYRPPSGSRFSASSWIATQPRSFAGAPNRVQPVEYRVQVPRDAEPGDHVSSLTVKRLPAHPGEGVTTIQAISVRLTVRVAGARREAVAIQSLNAPGLAGRGPITISTRVRNTGNVRLDFDRSSKGSLAILDGGDESRSQLFRGLLFPGETRYFELAWDDPPRLGHLKALASVTTRERGVSRSEGFWVVPWRQACALLLVALAAVVLQRGHRRRRLRAPAGRS
jgi:hypothetical protein